MLRHDSNTILYNGSSAAHGDIESGCGTDECFPTTTDLKRGAGIAFYRYNTVSDAIKLELRLFTEVAWE